MKNNVRRVMPTATAIAVALLLAAVLLSLPEKNKFGLADASGKMPIEEHADSLLNLNEYADGWANCSEKEGEG